MFDFSHIYLFVEIAKKPRISISELFEIIPKYKSLESFRVLIANLRKDGYISYAVTKKGKKINNQNILTAKGWHILIELYDLLKELSLENHVSRFAIALTKNPERTSSNINTSKKDSTNPPVVVKKNDKIISGQNQNQAEIISENEAIKSFSSSLGNSLKDLGIKYTKENLTGAIKSLYKNWVQMSKLSTFNGTFPENSCKNFLNSMKIDTSVLYEDQMGFVEEALELCWKEMGFE